MEKKEFRDEQLYLDTVEQYIDKRIAFLEERKEEQRKEIRNERKDMWENDSHGVNDFDDVWNLYLHSKVIDEGEKQYMETLKELQRLETMKNSPYFARIDVQEDIYPEEAVYIGALGLKNDKTHDMYVCDWRAPISSLFYGFDVGEAWYEVDGHRIDVRLNRKRQIQIEKGMLQNIYDTDSAMHDAILGGILSRNTGNKLKVIVSSIQKEQNTAIRKIDKKTVLIYGPAGSGKTSVGLHRLAYILYHQREKLRSEDIVILSNNTIYHSYVSGILPALCEDEVSHTIFGDLLRKFLPRDVRIENYYAQYKALQDMDAEAKRVVWLSVKYSVDMLLYIKDYFTNYVFELDDLAYRGHVIVTAKELYGKFSQNRYDSFPRSVEGLQDIVRKLFEDYFEENKDEICAGIEERIGDYISSEELELLFLREKRRAVQDTMERFQQRNALNAKEQLVRIVENFAEKRAEAFTDMQGMAGRLKEDLDRNRLWYEDGLLYLLVRIYMGEVKPFQNVLHVLVDEAQDYHLLQFAILKQLYPKSSFTLLADVCQAISPITTLHDYNDFKAVFGEDMETLPLLKSYRSSGPINALAFQLMSKFQKEYALKYSYFQREGKKPEYLWTKDIKSTVLEKLSQWGDYNLIGIIVEEEALAESLYRRLQNRGESVQRITKSTEEMKARILIMPLVLTKGLEYDAVLVCGRIKSSHGRKALTQQAGELYLACTRALHELVFVEEMELPDDYKDCEEYLQIVRK